MIFIIFGSWPLCKVLLIKILFYSRSISTDEENPLCDTISRKTLFYLIATLNATFPDYDFSGARSHEFSREPSLEVSSLLHAYRYLAGFFKVKSAILIYDFTQLCSLLRTRYTHFLIKWKWYSMKIIS